MCQFDIEIVQSSISNVAFDIVICGLWFLRPNAKIDQADPQIFEFIEYLKLNLNRGL